MHFLSTPNFWAISRFVLPSRFNSKISFPYTSIFTYFLGIAKPPRVVLLSYTGRPFVYCLLFTDLFSIKKFQALFFLNWKFTGRWASSWGQVKEGSQMALFPFTSLSMRFPFSCSRTSPYATLHNLPAIWCKSGVVVGVVDFRPKCPICRSDLQRNGLWLPWWLPRKSPSWC